jgi:hypothetical protein
MMFGLRVPEWKVARTPTKVREFLQGAGEREGQSMTMMQDESSRPDVSELKAVHAVFRDTLDAAPALVGGVEPSDTERRSVISNFYENVLAFLHSHHQTEEDDVFPPLRQRCPGQVSIVDRLAEQHEEVVGLAGAAEGTLSAWGAGDASKQRRCAEDLTKLAETLVRHLDDEESEALPLCADYLSIEEWAALPGHTMAIYQGDKVWLILGLIRQRMTQAQRDEMIAKMPTPALEMWNGFGEQAFDKLIAEVGTPLA